MKHMGAAGLFGKAEKPSQADFLRSVRESLAELFVKRSVAQCYDAAAEYYDAWAWQKVWRRVEWPILLPLVGRSRSVLEIGIGTGSVAETILAHSPNLDYVGIDISAGMLARCARKLGDRVRLVEADATNLDFRDLGGPFDFVLSCRMIGHVSNPLDIFARCSDVLADHGMLVVSDIDPGHGYRQTRLPTAGGRIPVRTYKHNPDAVVAAAKRAGLRRVCQYTIYEDDASASTGTEAPESLRGRRGPLSNLFVFQKQPN